jgi:hypothetical protein
MKQRRLQFEFLISPRLLSWTRGFCKSRNVKISHFIADAIEERLAKFSKVEDFPEFHGKLTAGRPSADQMRTSDFGYETLDQCIPDWTPQDED